MLSLSMPSKENKWYNSRLPALPQILENAHFKTQIYSLLPGGGHATVLPLEDQLLIANIPERGKQILFSQKLFLGPVENAIFAFQFICSKHVNKAPPKVIPPEKYDKGLGYYQYAQRVNSKSPQLQLLGRCVASVVGCRIGIR